MPYVDEQGDPLVSGEDEAHEHSRASGSADLLRAGIQCGENMAAIVEWTKGVEVEEAARRQLDHTLKAILTVKG